MANKFGYEIAGDGRTREIRLGDSWVELLQLLEMYYPDPADRQQQVEQLLAKLVDGGYVADVSMKVAPQSAIVNLDLSDARIESELFNDQNGMEE